MKILQKVALLFGCITIILGVIARLFFPYKLLFGLGAITYLRLTVVMLLFSVAFYFAHKE
ncbi:hypothetical protein AMJ87_09470 [candidate division WOR_3 bacterium SM23_60]|uniref:Uncharacterized protein n=1 Tax=candidate division WOR_3 bacterium SM23_60 TaxID=1703780 RepID=A0A0S8GBF1_UNCW3|nr:MAG: hypothetical protein AMJ87_09470 [candidate division WOR_3 bacterium SM23_60]